MYKFWLRALRQTAFSESIVTVLTFGLLSSVSCPIAYAQLAPLPPEPRVIGIRYQVWHPLRDLLSLVPYLDPKSENFLYRAAPDAAPDLSDDRETIEVLYPVLLAEYQALLKRPDIDELNDRMELPASIGQLAKFSQAAYHNIFQRHYYLRDLKVIATQQLINPAKVVSFLGFEIDHGPAYPSATDAFADAPRIGRYFESAITAAYAFSENISSRLNGIAKRVVAPGTRPQAVEEWAALGHDLDAFDVRSQLLRKVYYNVTLYKTDLDQRIKRMTTTELEDEVREFGRGSVKFRDVSLLRYDFLHDDGIYLVAPEELDQLLQTARYMQPRLTPAEVRQIFAETRTFQYVLTTAAFIESTRRAKQQRATFGDRAAALTTAAKGYLGGKLGPSSRTSLITTEPNSAPVQSLPQSYADVLGARLAPRNETLQARLWKIFIQAAGIDLGNRPTDSASICGFLMEAGEDGNGKP